MANLPISVLPNVNASGVTQNDLLVIVNYDVPTGTTKNITALDLQTYVNSGQTQLYEIGSGADSTQRIGIDSNAIGGCSVVSGGFCNTSSGIISIVGGGFNNTSSGDLSSIGGGGNNTSSSYYSVVSGGFNNTSSSYYSVVSGGRDNTSSSYNSIVSGGRENTSSGYYSVVGGGFCNTSSSYSSIVSGGRENISSGYYSVVGGGRENTLSGYFSTIGGGRNNTSIGDFSTISGGFCNTSSGYYSFIGGGFCNTSSGCYSFIGGGQENKTNCDYGTILGGSGNTINHDYSSAVGKDVTSVSACTLHVNYLALQDVPETDSINNNVLVRDVSTGVVKVKDISQQLNYSTTAITSSQTITWDKIYWGVSGASNVDLTLPTTTSKDGYFLIIKDEAGTSGSFRIRLTPTSGLIDGNSYTDMNINYMSLTIIVRNGNWYLI